MRESIVRRVRAYAAANKSLIVVFVFVFSAIGLLQLNSSKSSSGDSETRGVHTVAESEEVSKEESQTRAPAQTVEKATPKKTRGFGGD